MELSSQAGNLLLGGNFTGEQQPEETLRKRLSAIGSLRKLLLAFRDGVSSESDTLFGIEKRCLSDETLDTSHTTISHLDGGLSQDFMAVFGSELLDLSLLLRDLCSQDILQITSWGSVMSMMSVVTMTSMGGVESSRRA